MQKFPSHTIYDPGGNVYYVPFLDEDGRVGYSVSPTDGSREVFIYLNPSSNSKATPDSPNVFLYMGIENDPADDEPMHFYGIDFDHPELAIDAPECV